MVACLVGYIGGATNWLVWYDFNFPPVLNGGIAIFALILGYAILRHQLLDIEIIVKKTIVFAGLFAMVMIVVTGVTELTQGILAHHMTVSPVFTRMLSVMIALLFYDPTRKWLINATDRYLFQKKYNYHKLLKENSKRIAFIHSLDELAKQVVGFLLTQGRIKNAGLFTRRESGVFDLRYPLGYGGKTKRPRMQIDDRHAIVQLLNEKHAPFVLPDLEKELRQSKDDVRILKLRQVIETMKALKAQVLIPSFMRSPEDENVYALTTILVLGQKKSDEDYTEEDLDVFYTIAQDSAIAAENARLIDQIVLDRSKLIEAEQKAERINYTRTLKHEAGNKLVGVKNGADNLIRLITDQIHKFKNRFQDRCSEIELKMLDHFHAASLKSLRHIWEAGNKVEMIINNVVGALNNDPAAKQAIFFRVPWETAKRNAGVDYEFRFDVSMPDDFQIYGNVDLLEQLFENLFKNSRDAVGSAPEKLVTLKACYKEIEGGKACWFEYWDTGPGVPEAIHQKVFEQGFSTKPKPKSVLSLDAGHGQGLYVCRKIVEEFHRGKIWLEANPETKTSKFIFWIPSPFYVAPPPRLIHVPFLFLTRKKKFSARSELRCERYECSRLDSVIPIILKE